jgi:hypothetical protein
MIRKAFLALCAVAFLGFPITAKPQNTGYDVSTGNGLLATCNDSRNYYNAGLCMGTILGFANGFSTGEFLFKPDKNLENMQYCFPERVNNGQIRDVVVAYLTQNPGVRHRDSGDAVVNSLRNAFPCRSR